MDAIISINETQLLLLGDLGNYANHQNMISIFSLEMDKLFSYDKITPFPMKIKKYPLLCYKLHEYEISKFLTHCLTLDFTLTS